MCRGDYSNLLILPLSIAREAVEKFQQVQRSCVSMRPFLNPSDSTEDLQHDGLVPL